jgi:hypothetical protein
MPLNALYVRPLSYNRDIRSVKSGEGKTESICSKLDHNLKLSLITENFFVDHEKLEVKATI